MGVEHQSCEGVLVVIGRGVQSATCAALLIKVTLLKAVFCSSRSSVYLHVFAHHPTTGETVGKQRPRSND